MIRAFWSSHVTPGQKQPKGFRFNERGNYRTDVALASLQATGGAVTKMVLCLELVVMDSGSFPFDTRRRERP